MHVSSIIAAAASVVVFVYCMYLSNLARKSSHWPKTEGRVVISHVEVSNDSDGRSESPVFAYEFRVAGKTYVSTDVYAGWTGSWSTNLPGVSSARRFVSMHPLGSTVDVYYCPEDPSSSCIHPGRDAGPRLGMVLSLVGFVIALTYAQRA